MIFKPAPLKPGDAVAVIAPAGPVDPAEIQPGIELLLASGYEVITGEHLYDRRDYLAGPDEDRLADLHAVLRNPQVKAVLCARGGYGVHRLLDRIDFTLFRKHPKILVGYSDITALHLAVHRKTGLVTFHGPMVKDLLKNERRNFQTLLGVIARARTLSLDLPGAKVLRPGRAVGRLLGGNLSMITHLLGTGFMPDLKGAMLLVEDTGEVLYRIDRMLTHLRLSGRLKGISALVAGEFGECGDPDRIDELILDAVRDTNIPVLSRLPFGHGEANMTLPIGLPGVLDTRKLKLTLTEPAVAR
jgi:muramoyltetrapeptide carboxypeptidase